MPGGAKTISFCTTCKGRLYQLRDTLPGNLASLGPDEEIVLAGYDSRDGLAAWVWAHCADAIAAGRLRFFEVLDEAPWHVAKAKNLAHRLARGDYLFNLDADNFILPEDLARIRAARAEGLGCRQGPGALNDGTPGRIGAPRAVFHHIGGYDEGLLGMLVQDLDYIIRAEATGLRFRRLGAPARQPIQNDDTAKFGQLVSTRPVEAADKAAIGQLNMALADARRKLHGPLRRQNFATFRGLLNGAEVILDGLGNLTPVPG